MRVHFATTNKGKVDTINRHFSGKGIDVVHANIDAPEPRSDDLREIAGAKVLYAYSKIKEPCFAVDSGFYINSLKGFPRAYVNFALGTVGIEGLLRLVEGKERACEFRNCLAYFDDSLKAPEFFESSIKGLLAESERGVMRDYYWSELFLVFIPEGLDRTLAELSPEEYGCWRSKRSAESFTSKFSDWLCNRYSL